MVYYQQLFKEIINIIDILLDKLLMNIKSLPYLLKCICKIVSTFIKKKYPKSNKVEQNAFLARFLFDNLLLLIFDNPSLYGLINEELITEKTLNILGIIKIIFNRFMYGELFEENENFVIFNSYLIEKMPKFIEIMDNISQVKLPSFIDKFINDNLPEDYVYDYFKENPDENIFYRNICFNPDILYSLVINADKCKDKINLDKQSLSKLISNIKILKDIKNNTMENDDFLMESKRGTYFLLSDRINNKKYEKILNLKKDKSHFSIKEFKKIETDIQKIKNNRQYEQGAIF